MSKKLDRAYRNELKRRNKHPVHIEVYSCAEWPEDVYTDECGLHVSRDRHYAGINGEPARGFFHNMLEAIEYSKGICRALDREGFGGMRKHFPVRTWVEVRSQGPYTVQEKNDFTSWEKIRNFLDLESASQSCEAHYNKIRSDHGNTRVVLKDTELRVYPPNGDFEYVHQENR